MYTLKDIAQMAGVSKSTISRYLNQGQVSLETKERIEKIIKDTGYQPNSFAQSLKAQKNNMIGVIIPRFDSPSTNQVLRGIDQKSRQLNKQLLIVNSNLDIEREQENLLALSKQKVTGIILIAFHMNSKLLDLIEEIQVPVLVLGQENQKISYIVHDDYKAGYQLAQHACQLGHKHLLYVGVTKLDPSVGNKRRSGFVETAENLGIQVDEIESSFLEDSARVLAKKVLPDLKASYIACATDKIAMAFVGVAHELGIKVPHELSISGCGGYGAADYFTPKLTTVKFPYFESGQKAVELLTQQIDKPSQKTHLTLDNQLEKHSSTQAI